MLNTVIIPVKSFTMGKRRLAAAIDAGTRASLVRGLAERVASTVASIGLTPLIVTAEPEVAEWSTRAGFPSLPDPGTGLDEAARVGVEWVRNLSPGWMILHSDLPLVDAADVRALVSGLETRGEVIAPSADGGTSAIGSREVFPFSFGLSSFHRHLRRLDQPAVLARPGLLLDLDSPLDLQSAATTARGKWVGELVERNRGGEGGSISTMTP